MKNYCVVLWRTINLKQKDHLVLAALAFSVRHTVRREPGLDQLAYRAYRIATNFARKELRGKTDGVDWEF